MLLSTDVMLGRHRTWALGVALVACLAVAADTAIARRPELRAGRAEIARAELGVAWARLGRATGETP